MDGVRWYAYLLAFIMSVITGASTLMSVFTFTAYSLLGHTLSPDIIFTVMYMFGIAQWPLLDFPHALSRVAKSLISARRIEKVLMMPDLEGVDHCLERRSGFAPISCVARIAH